MALQRIARIAFVASVIAIVCGSLLPADDVPSLGMWDKLEHALIYASAAAIGAIAFAGRARAWLVLAAGLVALGASLEVAQAFVPGRLGDFGDGVANTVGTVAGLGLVAGVTRVAGRASRLGRGW